MNILVLILRTDFQNAAHWFVFVKMMFWCILKQREPCKLHVVELKYWVQICYNSTEEAGHCESEQAVQ